MIYYLDACRYLIVCTVELEEVSGLREVREDLGCEPPCIQRSHSLFYCSCILLRCCCWNVFPWSDVVLSCTDVVALTCAGPLSLSFTILSPFTSSPLHLFTRHLSIPTRSDILIHNHSYLSINKKEVIN